MVRTINWNGEPNSSAGPNSCQIAYDGGDVLYDPINVETFPRDAVTGRPAAVSTAIRDFLCGYEYTDGSMPSHGWTFLPSSQPVGLYAFTAPNLLDANGGASTKYIILDFVTSGKLFMKVYELVATGVAQNLAYRSDTAWATMSAKDENAVAATPGKLWISASARHFVMHSFSNGVYGNQLASYGDNGPIGVIEATRPHSADVGSVYSKYCHISGALGYQSTTHPLGFPKLLSGTGANGGTVGISTSFGAGGYLQVIATRPDLHMPLFADSLTGKFNASNLQCHNYGSTTANTGIIGTLMNYVAITRGYGAIIGEDIMLPMKADPNYDNVKFFDPTGTPESYWLLGGNLLGKWRFAVPK